MAWDLTIKITDVAIGIATILGPVLAVQAQKWLERGREIDSRRRQIFRMLMATRATLLAPAHVEALNAVPIEFYGPSKPKLKAITDAWHSYLDHLSVKGMEQNLWTDKRAELLVDLMFNMSTFLGYGFSKSEIKKDIYRPDGHVAIEVDQQAILQGLAQLLRGETTIPMAVKEFPSDPTAFANHLALQELVKDWLEGRRMPKVDTSQP